jgi:hypothetical protein
VGGWVSFDLEKIFFLHIQEPFITLTKGMVIHATGTLRTLLQCLVVDVLLIDPCSTSGTQASGYLHGGSSTRWVGLLYSRKTRLGFFCY